jgi:dipeptidyl aminopeptidase/acylaminoacyl peptidase
MMRFATAGFLACLLLSSRAISSFAQPVAALPEAEVTTATGSRGVMIRPVGDGPYPAILHLHGSGDTVANNVGTLRLFARAGYVAMDVEYRKVGDGLIDMQDIYRSLDYLNGLRYVRRGLIGLNGFSLGGRLALRIAAHQSVLAVSAIGARTSSGSNPTVLDEAVRLRAPILLQHGTGDSVVPYNDAVLLEAKLKRLGRSVELISYPGADHSSLPWDQVYDRVLRFFSAYLR